jgi:hypothetical protein
MGGKGVLSYIGTIRVAFEKTTKLFESIHHNFWFSMDLGS